MLRFFAVFVSFVFGAFLALQSTWAQAITWRVKTGTAALVAGAVSALGTPAIADGSHVRFAGTWIQIIDECTGVYAIVLLVGFVLAFPHSWRRRACALAAGIGLVTALNLARLVVLALLMTHRPDAAEFAHDYLWQVVWAGVLVAFALAFTRKPGPATT